MKDGLDDADERQTDAVQALKQEHMIVVHRVRVEHKD